MKGSRTEISRGEVSKGGGRGGGGWSAALQHGNGTHKTPQALANPTSDNPASTLIMAGSRQAGNNRRKRGKEKGKKKEIVFDFPLG